MKKLSLILILTIAFASLQGQTIPLTVALTSNETPITIRTCYDNEFIATFDLPTTFNQGFSITINTAIFDENPPNNQIINPLCDVDDLSGADPVSIDIISISPNVTSYNTSGSTGSNFTISNINASGTTVVITYKLRLDCSINFHTNIEQTWTHTMNSDLFLINATTIQPFNQLNIPDVYFVKLAQINTNIDEFPGHYLTTSELEFTYVNNGTATGIIDINFDNTVQCTNYTVTTTSYQVSTNSGATWSNPISITPGSWSNSVTLGQMDQLRIIQEIVVNGCIDVNNCNPINQQVSFQWRCSGDIYAAWNCDNCLDEILFNFLITKSDNIKLTLERVEPLSHPLGAPFSWNWDYSCPGDYNQWQLILSNEGASAIAISAFDLYTHIFTNNIQGLSLIDLSTIQLDFNCASCEILHWSSEQPIANLSTSVPITGVNLDNNCPSCIQFKPSLCSSEIQNPVGNLRFKILNLMPLEFVTINFATYKCCEENQALFNVSKAFNYYACNITGKDECSNPLSGSELVYKPGFEYSYWGAQALSNHTWGNYADINLVTDFTTSVTDLTVPDGQPYGETGSFMINLQNFILNDPTYSHLPDYQLLGSDPTHYNGILRVRIHCEQGLVPELDPSLINITSISNPGLVWKPFYIDHQSYSCIADDYDFYFNLSGISPFSPLNPNGFSKIEINRFLTNGELNFQLTSCCGPVNTVEYWIEFNLLMNSTGNCYNFTNPANPETCTDCCWLPMARQTGVVSVHCPGCTSPGIIVEKYQIKRATYGLQDSNNNGLADVGLIPIVPGNSYWQTYGKYIKDYRSMHGDLLTDTLIAKFQPGDPTYTPPGYNYNSSPFPNMKNDGEILNTLHLKRSFPYFDLMSVKIESFKFYIDKPGTGFCYECPPNYNFETMLAIEVPQNFLTNYVETKYNSMNPNFPQDVNFYTFTLANLANNQIYNNLINPFEFEENQRYRLIVNYNVCGNFNEDGTGSDFVYESQLNNLMALSGKVWDVDQFDNIKAAPNSIIQMESLTPIAYTFNPGGTNQCGPPTCNCTSCTVLTSLTTFAEDYIFFCESYGGRHFFVSNSVHNTSFFNNVNNQCIKRAYMVAESRIGSNSKDYFIAEFREPALKPSGWNFDIPPDYIINAASVKTPYGGIGNNSNWTQLNLSNLNITPTELIIAPSDLPLFVCAEENPPASQLNTKDEFLYHAIQLILIPDPALNCTVNPYTIQSDDVEVTFETDNSYCQSSNEIPACPITLGPIQMNLGPDPVTLTAANPNLQFNPTSSPIVNASTQNICWSFEFTNPDLGGTTSAYNIFIAEPNIPFMDNWSLELPGGNIIYADNNGGVVFEIAAYLLVGNEIVVTLCADYTDCQGGTAGNPATFKIQWGWNCSGYPQNLPLNQADVCFFQDFQLGIVDEPASMMPTRQDYNPQYVMCDDGEYIACFRSEHDGDVLPLGINLLDVPAGFIINGVQLLNCTEPNSQPGSVIGPLVDMGNGYWEITSPFYLIDQFDCICFKVLFNAGCALSPLDLPDVQLIYETYCGDSPASPPTASYPSIQSIGTICTDCFTITKTAVPSSVIPYQNVAFEIEVCNNNQQDVVATLSDDFATLIPDFVITSVNNLPLSNYLWPSSPTPCTTITVSGYFTDIVNCQDNVNVAELSIDHSPDPPTIITDDACVTVGCTHVSDYVWDNQNINSLIIGGISNPLVGKTINIRGTLTVNSSFTFDGCTLYMDPGAQIVILPISGIYLTLNNTVVLACSDMWKGIMTNTDVTLTVRASTIRDAERGITAVHGSIVTCDLAAFINNVVGIYVPPNPNINSNVITLKRTNFQQMGALRPGYNGQPAFGTMARAGMEINNWAGTLGSTTAGTNIFDNLHTGIIGFGSDIRIVNNKFRKIHNDPFYQQPWGGSAIASRFVTTPTKLNISPTNGGFTIDECDFGVYTMHTDLVVNGLVINNVLTGVFSTDCVSPYRSSVTNNQIYARDFGIDWQLNNGSVAMTAQDNLIHMAGNKFGAAINLFELTQGNFANYNISYNYDITLFEGYTGIRARGVGRPYIYGNTINQVANINTPTTEGILLDGGINAIVQCNNVGANFPGGFNATGIKVNMSTASTLECNDVMEQEVGIFYGGSQCTGANMKGNIMDNNHVGLLLNEDALIGQQPVVPVPPNPYPAYHGNRWTGTFSSTYGAVNLNAVPITNLELNLFTIRQGLANNEPTRPNGTQLDWNAVNNNAWFDLQNSGTTYACSTSAVCTALSPPPGGGGDGDRERQMRTAQDSSLTVGYIDESKAMAKQYLYEELTDDPVLLSSDTIFQNFKATHETSAIGKLYDAGQHFAEVGKMDSTNEAALLAADSLIRLYSSDIHAIDSIAAADSLTNYLPQKQILISQLMVQQQIIDIILQQQKLQDSLKLIDAALENSMAVTADLPHENEKLVNEKVIKLLNEGADALFADYAQILQVAVQCPYAGGESVYRARILIGLYNDTIEYDDKTVCQLSGYSRFQSTLNIPDVEIVPNPANDYVNIILKKEVEGICKVRLIDVLGKTVKEEKFNCDKKLFTIDTKSFVPGTYQVLIEINSEYKAATKLVIIR